MNQLSTEVKLYGFMAKKYGKSITVAGTSMRQILDGLKYRFGKAFHIDIEENNWVLVNGKTLKTGREISQDELQLKLAERVLHLVPAAIGLAKRFAQIIVGIILLVAAYFGYGNAETVKLGIMLIVGGVLNLVFAPKLPGLGADAQEGNYVYNGAVNVTTQGGAIPVIFGEVHRCASVVISSNFSTDEVGQLVDPGTGETDTDTGETFIDLP